MKLKDWDRPVIINEMVNIYNFQFYLNEGQTYRYKKLLPRIQSLIGKHGFRNSIKLLGERTFVNTFWHHPDEFLELFNRHNLSEYQIMTSSNSEVFCPEIHSIFMYNGSPLCMINDKGGLSIELSVYNIFHRGFRMPESYLNPLFSRWFQKSFGKVVNKVSGVDLYKIVEIKKFENRCPI